MQYIVKIQHTLKFGKYTFISFLKAVQHKRQKMEKVLIYFSQRAATTMVSHDFQCDLFLP
jgi:hypothetical protein